MSIISKKGLTSSIKISNKQIEQGACVTVAELKDFHTSTFSSNVDESFIVDNYFLVEFFTEIGDNSVRIFTNASVNEYKCNNLYKLEYIVGDTTYEETFGGDTEIYVEDIISSVKAFKKLSEIDPYKHQLIHDDGEFLSNILSLDSVSGEELVYTLETREHLDDESIEESCSTFKLNSGLVVKN